MKVLVMYNSLFSYRPKIKNMENVDEVNEGGEFSDCLVALIQVEKEDEDRDYKSRAKKLVNHLKWTSRKNECRRFVLHSFAHLSESKASSEFSKAVFDDAERRLSENGFEVAQTPFGYFLDLNIKAPGFSQARIFKAL